MSKTKQSAKTKPAPLNERIYYFPTLNRSVKAASLEEARKQVNKDREADDGNHSTIS